MIINQVKIAIEKLNIKNRSGIVTVEEIEAIKKKICRTHHIKNSDIENIIILKKSIDARKNKTLSYIYNIDVKIKGLIEEERKEKFNPLISAVNKNDKVIVVGAGPAGLFCAYVLALNGFNPILIEQGSCIEERVMQTEKFWNDCKQLDIYSNVIFGEGGAGTFSDGKLNTLVKDKFGYISYVKKVFAAHGAPDEIIYLDKPHIGTDRLREVIINMRKEIERLGGTVHFNECVTDFSGTQNKVTAVSTVTTKDNVTHTYECDKLVLATGHSARKTYEMIKDKLTLEKKDFAIGLRVQHKQEFIDAAQYGHMGKMLPPADYKLRFHASNDRAVYSFCMCPGGHVVNTSTEEGFTVVNGMSDYKRDSENANSAIVVNVTKDDFESDDVLAGVAFQRKWEEKAYEACKGKIPVQRFADFKNDKKSEKIGDINVVVKGEYDFANIRDMLPCYVNDAITEAMNYFDGLIPGYADDDVILCGVETRTSAPVRIVRDETMQSNIAGIYPCGEGAGYAGGIMSAAVDGIKVALAIMDY